MTQKVAESRRSQLIDTFGVGAMYPAPEQSLMICGLDEWPAHERQEICEQRLAQSLEVSHLYAPASGRRQGDVPVVRFPRWYFCPECRRLAPWIKFDVTKRHPRCTDCERDAVPSRFVVICRNGHIDDFPFARWVHDGRIDPEHFRQMQLELVTKGETSALADVEIKCGCGARRTMEGSFSPTSLVGITSCSGRRPWLPKAANEQCSETPRVVQRGSSSAWFADLRSAISIPPWSDIHNKVRGFWSMLKNASEEDLRVIFRLPGWTKPGSHWTVDDLIRAVVDLRSERALDDESLRRQEYQAILAGHEENDPADQFTCLPVSLDGCKIHSHVDTARNVSRLREVRVLVSFTRMSPPGTAGVSPSKLSLAPMNWLPAMEVFGEGLFVRFSELRLKSWEESDFARRRSALIAASTGPDIFVTPRKLLLHTFAHAFMNELSLDAGYPVSSLRERVYAGKEQAGVLVYTATADSAGSLGGLSAQSDPERLDAVIRSAMHRALWCTSDPVCIESPGSGIDNLNLAACHACMLVPETSCEQRNCYLDRALLIGLPDRLEAGFFSELVGQ